MYSFQLRSPFVTSDPKKRSVGLFDEAHSYRYAFHVSLVVAFVLSVCFLALARMLMQNYQFFINQALIHSPGILSHIERERNWAFLFLFVSGLAIVVVNLILILRLIRRFSLPATELHQHLMQLSRGRWFVTPIEPESSVEFRSLFNEYNYFYKSLQTITAAEISLLEKIPIDPNNREAMAILNQLISDKKNRLGVEEIIVQNVAALVSVQSMRRAS